MTAVDILPLLEDFFRCEAPLDPADRLVVAFSGGPDSTALLFGLLQLSRSRGFAVTAAHLDHGMDPGSAARAQAAARIAESLGAPFIAERRSVSGSRESAEAAARRIRYGFLEEVRRDLGARYVATGHHRDDQAETVLLRLLFGSGVEGLAGIRPVHGHVVRPLLAASRAELRAAVEAAGLVALEDPTNFDPGPTRNRVRHSLLPALPEDTGERLARLAARARLASAVLDRRLAQHLDIQSVSGGAAADLRQFEELPEPLRPHALAALHRRAGAPYPAGAAARAELFGQLGRTAVGCDCGGGWRWEARGGRLVVFRQGARAQEGARLHLYSGDG